jgi:L-gulonate 3-dehydrogenase
MEKIAVIGAGVIGRVWAVVFARAGFQVSIHETPSADGAETLRVIRARLQDLRSYGLLADPEDDVFARVSLAPTLEAALDGAVHAQESGVDTLETKVEWFTRMDRIAAPGTVLASSTSVVFPSHFTENVPGRRRCIVVHPVQPPYALRAVEIVPGQWTDPATVARSRALVERCGLVPIMVRREVPGYAINSLQVALMFEALRLVSQGIVSAQDCEAVVKHGLGPRWSFMGPFETAGINGAGGLAEFFERQADFYTEVQATHKPPRLTPELIREIHEATRGMLGGNEQGARREWRDRRLMALARHKSEQPD